MLDRLKELNEKIMACDRCSICHLDVNRDNPEKGYGKFCGRLQGTGQIFIVGTAPGSTRHPGHMGAFARKASGGFLGEVLDILDIHDVYTTNLLKCSTPNNRPPEPEEIKNCDMFLELELDMIKPLLIVPAGAEAIKYFQSKMTKAFSKTIAIHRLDQRFGKWYFPIYHPGYYLRTGVSPEEAAKKMAGLKQAYLQLKSQRLTNYIQ